MKLPAEMDTERREGQLNETRRTSWTAQRTAVFDGEQCESGNVEEAQSGGEEGEHRRESMGPDAAQFPAGFFLRVHVIPFRVPIPPE